jgi:hypothetical protein
LGGIETFAETHADGEEAPIPAIRLPTIGRSKPELT